MSRNIFGWSYPPGCSGPPDEEPGPCTQCGRSEYDCICPECPICESVGDTECYEKHGLKLNDEQIDGLIKRQEIIYWERGSEELYWDQYNPDLFSDEED